MPTILKKEAIVNDNHSFLLSDLPFPTGEKVMVFVVTEADFLAKLNKWRTLFAETQNLPSCQQVTETEIDAEIAAYRAGCR